MNSGSKLRELRKKAGKTLQEAAEIFGVKLNTVYRWEHDQAAPDCEMLKKIAEYYGAPIEWLLRDNSDGAGGGMAESENAAQHGANGVEQRIAKIMKKLPENCKHRILGYIEHIYMEMYEN
jgi:transcriptional regulator with XRE-family HTH domain